MQEKEKKYNESSITQESISLKVKWKGLIMVDHEES